MERAVLIDLQECRRAARIFRHPHEIAGELAAAERRCQQRREIERVVFRQAVGPGITLVVVEDVILDRGAGLLVNEREGVELEDIGAGTSGQRVVPRLAVERVIAGAADERVVAGRANEDVVAEATGKGVVAPIAGDGVVAGAADHVLDADQRIGADVDAFRLGDGRVGRIAASKQQVADRPSPVCGLKVAVGEIEVDGDAVCGR